MVIAPSKTRVARLVGLKCTEILARYPSIEDMIVGFVDVVLGLRGNRSG
jgi:hypothetical protein